MGLIQGGDLSLGCKRTSTTNYSFPCMITEFLEQVSRIGIVSERLLKFDDFIRRLEDELRKIDAFKRELPLCMLLLNDAIVAVKEEETQCRKLTAEPVLEEFIPLNKSCDQEDANRFKARKESKDTKEKMNWLSSMQLWNTSELQQPNQDLRNNGKNTNQDVRKRTDDEVRPAPLDDPIKSRLGQSMGIGLLPLNGYSGFPSSVTRKEEKMDLPGLSLRTLGMKNITEDILVRGMGSKTSASRACSSSLSNSQSSGRGPKLNQQNTRKQRRCWSPDLHRRFIEALQQLGGLQVATPKQIREVMQVDDLTNDEVKSHLQKYRLHARRAPAASSTVPNQPECSGDLWSSQDQFGETSKQFNSNSGSPPGPLHFGGTSQGTSMTGCDDIHDEDEEKSDSCSLKFHAHSSETSNI